MRGSGRLVLVSLMALVVPLAAAQAAPEGSPQPCDRPGTSMVVHVTGVRSGRGTLVAVLYGDQPEQFLKKGGRLARERASARPGTVAICLVAPRPGTYAVAVYHDENGNGKFDRSWMGLPTEGFGLSNNPRPVLRVPTLAESAIQVGSGHSVVNIDLHY